MSAITYPDQTRFALREGVTCMAAPDGAVLLNPARNEKLTGLADAQIAALEALNQGPSTLSDMTRDGHDGVGELVERLTDRGWLSVTVRDGGRDLYTVRPFANPPERPAGALPWSAALSKFTVLRRDSAGFVLEHPQAWSDLRIHDPRLLALLDGPGAADTTLPYGIRTQFADDLYWCGFVVADPDAEDQEFPGPAHHARSRCHRCGEPQHVGRPATSR